MTIADQKTELPEDVAIAVLRGVMREFQAVLRRRAFPNSERPCHTCAFNPSTWSLPGFEGTTMTLLHAIMTDQPFYCHDNIPIVDGEFTPSEGQHFNLCAGWAATMDATELKTALIRVMWRLAGHLDEPQWDNAWTQSFTLALTTLVIEEREAALEKCR